MKLEEQIPTDPAIRSGKPRIKGTWINPCDILEYLAGGRTEAEIRSDSPSVAVEAIRASLAFDAA